MMTKSFLIAFVLLGLTASCFSQGGAYIVDAATTPSDSTAIPSFAQLKAQVLQGNVSSNGAVNVPSEHRAFFCRLDDKLDKKRIPLRMRLGSLEEVNRMEAKPGFRAGQVLH